MSPEQVAGKPLDERTDLFSFGVTLYEMASGRMPFDRDTTGATYGAILHEGAGLPSQWSPQVPPQLDAVISKALEKDRNLRYQHASEMRADLQRLKRNSESGQSRVATSGAVAVAEASVAGRGTLRKIVAPVLLFVFLVGGGLYYRSHQQSKRLTDKDTIVLADFTNTTGESVFDDTLKQALAIQLEQSPYLKLLSDQKIRSTLKLMDKPPDTRLNNETAREVCQRSNSRGVISGSIDGVGSHYLIGLRALDCQTGDLLGSSKAEAESRDAVLRRLGDAGDDLRGKLGESLASVQRYSKPLDQATTSSLDALKAFSEGRQMQWQKGDSASIPFHKRAVELDPNFARAYAALGMAQLNLGQSSAAMENFTKAFEVRDRVSERERFYIEASYYSFVTGELQKANEVYRQWIAAYPDDSAPYTNLSLNESSLGEYQKSVELTRQAIRLRPDLGGGYSNLLGTYVCLDRLDEAKAVYEQAIAMHIENEFLHEERYYIGFLEQDEATMQQQLDWARGKPNDESQFLWVDAQTAAYHGEVSKGRKGWQTAAQQAKTSDNTEQAALITALFAGYEAEVGNVNAARQQAAAALVLNGGKDEMIAAGVALARAGDMPRAQKIADKLNQKFPADTIIQDYWLPTIRASIALQRNNPQQAITDLEAARPYELGNQGYGPLYPVYVRGMAYLHTKQGELAEAEFNKILNHRGLMKNSLLGVLAQLQLGRAQAMSGDTAAARKSYQDFLANWKNADPDIPVLLKAKAEYSKLQ